MIAGTILRQGRLPAPKGTAVSSLYTALTRGADMAAPARRQQQQARFLFAAAAHNTWHPNSLLHPTPVEPRGRWYHVSPTPRLSTSATDASPNQAFRRTLTPSLRAALISDLRSVDFDHNGRIDADELKALLRKHGSFAEEEILELSELFYASLGATSVDVEKFVDAFDAVVAQGATGDEPASPLSAKGKLKTHPLGIGTCASEYSFSKSHGKYTEEDLDIELTHVAPKTFSDRTALFAVKCVRFAFDTGTLWNVGSITKGKILYRAIFLETIAAIPGMVAAVIRHFRSLRNMARDGGMLNMFLEEANNERMHLLIFIRMKEPGYLFRAAVLGGQFGFGVFFLTAYILSPNWCHRFVGYVEEEACHTYTKILDEMDKAPDGSELSAWKMMAAPKIARGYYHLGEHGTVHDVMKAVRADEAEHRDVNHAVSGVPEDTVNPLYDPRIKLDDMLKKYVKDLMAKEASKHTSVA